MIDGIASWANAPTLKANVAAAKAIGCLIGDSDVRVMQGIGTGNGNSDRAANLRAQASPCVGTVAVFCLRWNQRLSAPQWTGSRPIAPSCPEICGPSWPRSNEA
ncbi:MAG: hypothetical protein JO370_10040 [Paucibacter sp.]|nr:hypothetical protein [Roseateles sp.]